MDIKTFNQQLNRPTSGGDAIGRALRGWMTLDGANIKRSLGQRGIKAGCNPDTDPTCFELGAWPGWGW